MSDVIASRQPLFHGEPLHEKVAVVTGAGTGIGAGICDALAEAGANVVVAYNSNRAGGERVAETVRARGRRVLLQKCSVADKREVDALFDATLAELGRVDIMVNNSGITKPKHILNLTEDEWDETLDVNLKGMFLCGQRAARDMVRRGEGGQIINLSSVHSAHGFPEHAHYEASKGGVNQLTRGMAVDLAPYGITVNAIAPGMIEVERYHGFAGYTRESWGRRAPLGRVGFPPEIAPMVVFLCTSGGAYMTGEVIFIDGGVTARMAL